VAVAGASGKGGIVLIPGEEEDPWLDAGMRLIVRGTDNDLLVRVYQEIRAAHAALVGGGAHRRAHIVAAAEV
jgi:hypothetical protein